MKEVLYRGGLLQFKIPENYVEEYDEVEGATFYEDAPHTGTLRLNVITLEKPGGSVAEIGDFLIRKNADNGTLRKYTSVEEKVIIEYWNRCEEENIPITVVTFSCINEAGAGHFQLANFTWTIETRFEDSEYNRNEVEILRDSIRKLKFG